MQLTGELKEKVDKSKSKEEAKKIIEEAGVELSDEEIEAVTGGGEIYFQVDEDPIKLVTQHIHHPSDFPR